MCPGPHQNSGRGLRRDTNLSSPVFFFTDRSKAALFSGSFMLFLSSVCHAFVCVCLLIPCDHMLRKGLTSWLSFVMPNCEFVTFP